MLDPELEESAPALDPELVESAPALDPELVESAPALDPELVESAPALDPELMESAPALDPKLVESAQALDHGLEECSPTIGSELKESSQTNQLTNQPTNEKKATSVNCPICKKIFKRVESVKLHLFMVHGRNPRNVKIENGAFVENMLGLSQTNSVYHSLNRISHANNIEGQDSLIGRKIMSDSSNTCKLCNKTFSMYSSYKRHCITIHALFPIKNNGKVVTGKKGIGRNMIVKTNLNEETDLVKDATNMNNPKQVELNVNDDDDNDLDIDDKEDNAVLIAYENKPTCPLCTVSFRTMKPLRQHAFLVHGKKLEVRKSEEQCKNTRQIRKSQRHLQPLGYEPTKCDENVLDNKELKREKNLMQTKGEVSMSCVHNRKEVKNEGHLHENDSISSENDVQLKERPTDDCLTDQNESSLDENEESMVKNESSADKYESPTEFGKGTSDRNRDVLTTLHDNKIKIGTTVEQGKMKTEEETKANFVLMKNNVKENVCLICNKMFTSWFSLRRHYITVHQYLPTSKMKHRLREDIDRLKTSTGLSISKKICMSPGQKMCPICGKKYTKYETVKMHAFLEHKTVIEIKKGLTEVVDHSVEKVKGSCERNGAQVDGNVDPTNENEGPDDENKVYEDEGPIDKNEEVFDKNDSSVNDYACDSNMNRVITNRDKHAQTNLRNNTENVITVVEQVNIIKTAEGETKTDFELLKNNAKGTVCLICNKIISSFYSLRRHYITVHHYLPTSTTKHRQGNNIDSEKTNTSISISSSKDELSCGEKKIYISSGQKVCPVCGKKYTKYENVKMHAFLEHNTVIEYTRSLTEVDDDSFQSVEMVDNEKNSTLLNIENKCIICDMIFSSSSSLKLHLNVVHQMPLVKTCLNGENKNGIELPSGQSKNDGRKVKKNGVSVSENEGTIYENECISKESEDSQDENEELMDENEGLTEKNEGFNDGNDGPRNENEENMEKHRDSTGTGKVMKSDIVCNICKQQFKTLSSLKTHTIVKHTVLGENKKVLSVYAKHRHLKPSCAQPSKSDSEMKKIVNGYRFKCSYCPKVFSRIGHKLDHERTHTGERPFMCHICGKCFMTKNNQKNHTKCHTEAGQWRCDLCDKRLSRENCLKQHIQDHLDVKPFKCTQCDKAFVTKHQLGRHEVTHDVHQTAQCEICGGTMKNNDSLKHHKRKCHSKTEFVQCNVCLKEVNKLYLSRHMRINHGKEKFWCKMCGKFFNSNEYLLKHKKYVHTERNF